MATINLDRSLGTLMQISMQRLSSTSLTAKTPGAITRLLLAAVNQVAKDFYDTLKLEHAQAYLSTATDGELDDVGIIVACKRQNGESDDNYRFRISQQTSTLAAANQTAVRLAVLSVPGVIDCLMKPYTHGTGSGSVFVVTQDPYPSDDFLQQVQQKVDEVAAFGNRIYITTPKPIPVQIGAKLIFKKTSNPSDQANLISNARQTLKNYLTDLVPGQSLILDEMIAKIMALSTDIYDIQFYSFIVNGRPALLVNQDDAWNERFVESNIPNAIQVS